MSYDDFYLVPKKSIVSSRSECDTSLEFGGYQFNLSIVPSNMSSVVNFELCTELAKRGYFYIMHRFVSYDDIYKFVVKMNNEFLISSISIGVKQADYDLIDQLKDNAPDYITIDIAHGHSYLMRDMITHIRKQLPNVFIITGNVASQDAVDDLTEWGASCIKYGVGPSPVCNTYPNTGFYGHPATLLNELNSTLPIIADGGASRIGHIVKAVVLGADMVMVGGMLSGFNESPGDVFEINGEQCKIYAGSTANNIKHIEGKSSHVALKGSIWDYLDVIEQNTKSAISYAGGTDLSAFNHVEIKRY